MLQKFKIIFIEFSLNMCNIEKLFEQELLIVLKPIFYIP